MSCQMAACHPEPEEAWMTHQDTKGPAHNFKRRLRRRGAMRDSRAEKPALRITSASGRRGSARGDQE
eukprot:12536142-Prorocentrum_lima.AAC.1